MKQVSKEMADPEESAILTASEDEVYLRAMGRISALGCFSS